MNRKGFTLIELLVAAIILFIVMVGFLRGILLYTELQIRNQLKDRASEISTAFANYIRTTSFSPTASCDSNHPNPFLCSTGYSYPNNWDLSRCIGDNCTFEEVDADGDGIPDFYDPYNGNNQAFRNNANSTASWLRIVPCNCNVDYCGCCYRDGNPTTPNLKCGERFKGRFIYTASTLASLQREGANIEIGRAVGLIVWYFDTNGNYKSIHSTVIRSLP